MHRAVRLTLHRARLCAGVCNFDFEREGIKTIARNSSGVLYKSAAERERRPSVWRASSVHEGTSWACVAPRTVLAHPRKVSRKLRHRGSPDAALRALEASGLGHSRHDEDLLEVLLALQATSRFKGPRERIEAMLEALWASPTAKPRAAFAIVLTACAREASRMGDNSASTTYILEKATTLWEEVCALRRPSEDMTALMLRIAGDCRALELTRSLRSTIARPGDKVVAAYLLALGKCGRSSEAEAEYFTPELKAFRGSDLVLSALFEAHVCSSRISRAEGLLSVHGSSFLTVAACNSFVRQCASLRLHDTAFDFVARMRGGGGFPAPNAGTYNLLLKGLSAGTGTEDRAVAADRALALVETMGEGGLAPTTVTYNALIRSLVLRGETREALRLYRRMAAPNRVTFSHLMQGAAQARDARLARALLFALERAGERPNYGFCKSYLSAIARVDGVPAAFPAARDLASNFSGVLVFGDVGGREAVRMALIAACGQAGDLDSAFQALHEDLGGGKPGALAPLYIATVLMQACIECGSLGRAFEVFDSLKAANVRLNFEVYESLIYGLASYARTFGAAPDERGGEEKPNADTNDVRHAARMALADATELVCEMHERGCARAGRPAAYVYNTLIAAAGQVGDFDLASQVFYKMGRHTNAGVVYVARPAAEVEGDVSEEVFGKEMNFPNASVGTYNSMINTAWRCGFPHHAFDIYGHLLTDRINEPNAATFNLLLDIAFDCSDVGANALRGLLKDLDRVAFLPREVAQKRVRLRQKVLALQWL